MGGQIGDTGTLRCGHNLFIVENTKHVGKAIIHVGRVELGQFSVGQTVTAEVDAQRRKDIASHHTRHALTACCIT